MRGFCFPKGAAVAFPACKFLFVHTKYEEAPTVLPQECYHCTFGTHSSLSAVCFDDQALKIPRQIGVSMNTTKCLLLSA